jgi:hypothetical protein
MMKKPTSKPSVKDTRANAASAPNNRHLVIEASIPTRGQPPLTTRQLADTPT